MREEDMRTQGTYEFGQFGCGGCQLSFQCVSQLLEFLELGRRTQLIVFEQGYTIIKHYNALAFKFHGPTHTMNALSWLAERIQKSGIQKAF